MIKSAIYFHGLESSQGGIKVQFLDQEVDFLEAPAMDYTKEGIFEEWLDYVKNEEPDLLIGSSMGGYFAMALATHTGIPVLVFNPAIHSRSIEIGKKDEIIDPGLTMSMLKGTQNNLDIIIEKEMGHRVPLDVFVDMYNKMVYNGETIRS